jgi:carboxypeptidase PM20D1
VEEALVDPAIAAEHLARVLSFPTLASAAAEPYHVPVPAPFAALHKYLRTTYAPVFKRLKYETVCWGGHRTPAAAAAAPPQPRQAALPCLRCHRTEPAALPRLSLHRPLQVNEWSLLLTWEGRDPGLKPLLLLSHCDVVPAAPGDWTHPPFGGVIADGCARAGPSHFSCAPSSPESRPAGACVRASAAPPRRAASRRPCRYVWGRGAVDFKSGLVQILEAVAGLLAQGYSPERTVYLAFGHDEEVGGETGELSAGPVSLGFRFAAAWGAASPALLAARDWGPRSPHLSARP